MLRIVHQGAYASWDKRGVGPRELKATQGLCERGAQHAGGTGWASNPGLGARDGFQGKGSLRRVSKEEQLGLKALGRGQAEGPPVPRPRGMNSGLHRRACVLH